MQVQTEGHDDDAEVAVIETMRSRLRRSLHFVPGSNERMLAKSLTTDADTLILDLEDAVAPNKKIEARNIVAKWLHDVNYGDKEKAVRINGLDTPWALDDLSVTMESSPDAYVIPKLNSFSQLEMLDTEISRLEKLHGYANRSIGLILIATETANGALEVTSFRHCPRVVALTWGAEDLSAALGSGKNRDQNGQYISVFQYCRAQTLLTSVAGGMQPVDAAFVDLTDHDVLVRECEEGATLGFTGKLTIHPDQIPIVNETFTPKREAIEKARRLVQAFTEAQEQGIGAIRFEGQMVDVPHFQRAQSLLNKAAQAGIT